MESAVTWLLGIGGIVIGIGAAIYWGDGNKTVALWIGVFGAILIVVAGGFQLQHIIDKSDARPDATNRPWISIDHIDVEPLVVGSSLRAAVHFTNGGNRPALNVRAWVQSTTVPKDGTPPQPLIQLPDMEHPSGVIMPTRSLRIWAFNDDQFKLRLPADVDLIKSAALVPWIAARVEYTDTANGQYHTTFRGFYNHAVGTYVIANPGNEAK